MRHPQKHLRGRGIQHVDVQLLRESRFPVGVRHREQPAALALRGRVPPHKPARLVQYKDGLQPASLRECQRISRLHHPHPQILAAECGGFRQHPPSRVTGRKIVLIVQPDAHFQPLRLPQNVPYPREPFLGQIGCLQPMPRVNEEGLHLLLLHPGHLAGDFVLLDAIVPEPEGHGPVSFRRVSEPPILQHALSLLCQIPRLGGGFGIYR